MDLEMDNVGENGEQHRTITITRINKNITKMGNTRYICGKTTRICGENIWGLVGTCIFIIIPSGVYAGIVYLIYFK